MLIHMYLKEMGCEGGTGFIWLRIGSSGCVLWTWYWSFRFHKKWEGFWSDEWLSASQGGLYSVESVGL